MAEYEREGFRLLEMIYCGYQMKQKTVCCFTQNATSDFIAKD